MKRRNRGNIRYRGRDQWQIKITLPGAKTLFETVHGKRGDAARRLTELLGQLDSGLPLQRTKLSLGDYLSAWLRDVVAVRNAPRTLDAYSTIVKLHIIPALGRLPLNKVAPSDIETMEAALITKGLSRNTVHHVHVALSKAFTDAMRKGVLHYNPCKMMDAPTPGRYEVKLPDSEAVKRMLEASWQTLYGMMFHFMAFTGVRRGEAVALKWENVDIERGVVSIVESAQRIGRRGILIQPPKSAAGRRGIALDPGTIALLREHRGKQLLHEIELEGAYQDRGYVFPNSLGNVQDPSVVTRNFEKLVRQTGSPHIRLHDLRHAHAAGLIRANVHVRVIQERLGHASAAFTMQVYGHVTEGLQKEAAQAYADMMRG